jgi:hypothetical protein
MHRAVCLIALLCASPIVHAQTAKAPPKAQTQTPRKTAAPSDPKAPPHAWLFGTWTGGLFPSPPGITAAQCLAQPVVIFTRDIVLRATLVDELYHQRVIETLRASPQGMDFRFAPGISPLQAVGAGLMGGATPPAPAGFGCENPDVLHVQRRSDTEIVFQGCADFPEPLVRCPSK